ncbi:DNA replication/repair protein RecF [Luteimonas vadosa]|uniref:DNA replication and repair protein RecF n=1 Tax=Luteimonas vadosa TaxID=1165507 RepID=A0ABP9DQD1_9GAMM
MKAQRLEIRNLRSLRQAWLDPDPRLNLLVGDNGAGKTSVLEALHVMAYGRSFRGRIGDGLVRTSADALEIFVQWQEDGQDRIRKAGLRHGGQDWEGRLDGLKVAQLGELCAALMVVTIEPGCHALVSGGGEPRRRFMDWGLFHVEQGFLADWRRYARSLKQRNALLKARTPASQLLPWELELATAGERLTRARRLYLERLEASVAWAMDALAPGLGAPRLEFHPGWRQDEVSLADALVNAQERDRSLGYTSIGPHRGDWRLRLEGLPNDEPLSRGQAKIAAISCLLGQARDCATQRGDWPIVSVDDLASELDRSHQRRLVETLVSTGAQVFMTGTEEPQAVAGHAGRVFHVEHGVVAASPAT